MKFLLSVAFLFVALPVFGQVSGSATSTYARNGKLIGLTNLSGLNDCSVKNAAGRVKKVKVNGNVAKFRLRSKEETQNIEVNLAALSESDRASMFKDLVRSGYPIRVGGYTCSDDADITAFSIDRIYRTHKSKPTPAPALADSDPGRRH